MPVPASASERAAVVDAVRDGVGHLPLAFARLVAVERAREGTVVSKRAPNLRTQNHGFPGARVLGCLGAGSWVTGSRLRSVHRLH